MHIDAEEDDVVGEPIHDRAVEAAAIRQARELAVGIVERVGQEVQRHADEIQAHVAVVVEMARHDADASRRAAKPCSG